MRQAAPSSFASICCYRAYRLLIFAVSARLLHDGLRRAQHSNLIHDVGGKDADRTQEQYDRRPEPGNLHADFSSWPALLKSHVILLESGEEARHGPSRQSRTRFASFNHDPLTQAFGVNPTNVGILLSHKPCSVRNRSISAMQTSQAGSCPNRIWLRLSSATKRAPGMPMATSRPCVSVIR